MTRREPVELTSEAHRSLQGTLRPEPGDYWHDTFEAPVCVVLDVTDTSVTVCDKCHFTKGQWRWQTAKTRTLTRDGFREWLMYRWIEATWAKLKPGAHQHVAREWKGHASGKK